MVAVEVRACVVNNGARKGEEISGAVGSKRSARDCETF